MILWRAFLLWCAQLVLLVAFWQVIFWLYGVEDGVTAWLAGNRELTTAGLILYFGTFAVYVVFHTDAVDTDKRRRHLRDENEK